MIENLKAKMAKKEYKAIEQPAKRQPDALERRAQEFDRKVDRLNKYLNETQTDIRENNVEMFGIRKNKVLFLWEDIVEEIKFLKNKYEGNSTFDSEIKMLDFDVQNCE